MHESKKRKRADTPTFESIESILPFIFSKAVLELEKLQCVCKTWSNLIEKEAWLWKDALLTEFTPYLAGERYDTSLGHVAYPLSY